MYNRNNLIKIENINHEPEASKLHSVYTYKSLSFLFNYCILD